MNIGIDISPAVHQHAGIARYTVGLTIAILDDRDDRQTDTHERLTCLYTPGRAEAPLPLSISALATRPGVSLLPLHGESPRSWRMRAALAHMTRQTFSTPPWSDLDVFIAPDFVFPPLRHTPTLVIMHDLSFCLFPQFHTLPSRLSSMYFTQQAVKVATHILCDSRATQNDLLHLYPAVAKRSSVLYPGINESVTRIPESAQISAVLQRYKLDERGFVLGVGTLEPRKNMKTLLQAYRLLADDPGEKTTLPPLAIVGSGGWLGERERLATMVGAADVRFLGFVPDDDLSVLYRSCAAFVYPSYAEGFGLPVAEALAAGAPVICSRTTSLPEAGGDAALYVDPHRPADLAAMLRKLLHDPALSHELAMRGPLHAAQFRWSRAVEQLREVIARVTT